MAKVIVHRRRDGKSRGSLIREEEMSSGRKKKKSSEGKNGKKG